MSSVMVKVEAGREWVMRLTRVPIAAARIQDCETTFVKLDGPLELEVGAVVVECLRNDKGVQTAVVMPNGYCFPTGRIAPRADWFPMLKASLRTWLATSPDGRVFLCARNGIDTMRRLQAAGRVDEARAERAVAKLTEALAGLTGGPPRAASEEDVVAGFFNWVTEMSVQSGLTQPEVVAAVGRAVRTGAPTRVPDLDDSLIADGIQRFLDI